MKKYKHKKILSYAIVILFILGCFFRLSNLNIKPYWGDEVYTSIRIFGYTRTEIIQAVANGHVLNIKDIQKFQQLDPERGVSSTVSSLMAEDAELTPLYFVIARVWAQFFGDSVAAMRLLPSLFSLLSIPCIYWLCLELFESSSVAYVAVVMSLLSPVHIVYAQESRFYSLWILTTLLSCACFLKAVKTNRRVDWLIYAITIPFSLYSCLLSGVTFITHGTYIFLITKFRQAKTILAYLLATLLGFIAFTPWLLVILSKKYVIDRAKDSTWSHEYLSAGKHWSGFISRVFIDFNFTAATEQSMQFYFMLLVTLLVLLLTSYSLYFLVCQTPQKIWLFVLLLLLAIPIILIPESISPTFPIRYVLPSFLAIQLAVAYTLGSKFKISKRIWQNNLWAAVLALVMLSELTSCTLYFLSNSWWNKYYNEDNHQIAEIINQQENALTISDLDGDRFEANLSNVISLSYLLNPKRTKLQIVVRNQVPEIPKQFAKVFALTPSVELLQGLEKKGYTVLPVYKGRREYRDSDIYLWQVKSAAIRS